MGLWWRQLSFLENCTWEFKAPTCTKQVYSKSQHPIPTSRKTSQVLFRALLQIITCLEDWSHLELYLTEVIKCPLECFINGYIYVIYFVALGDLYRPPHPSGYQDNIQEYKGLDLTNLSAVEKGRRGTTRKAMWGSASKCHGKWGLEPGLPSPSPIL